LEEKGTEKIKRAYPAPQCGKSESCPGEYPSHGVFPEHIDAEERKEAEWSSGQDGKDGEAREE